MSKKKILVVEDQVIIAEQIKDCIINFGYEVPDIAVSGESAVKKAKEILPDLIIMDIQLKGEMDGISAAKEIHKEIDMPIVYLTAYTNEQTIAKAKKTVPVGYIKKPFSQDIIRITLEMAFEKVKTDKELKHTKLWQEAVLKSITDAIITTDKNYRINFINPVAEKLLNLSFSDVQNKHISDVFVINENQSQKDINYFIDKKIKTNSYANSKQTNFPHETILVNSFSENIPIEFSLSIIKNNNIEGFAITFRDISKRKEAEKKLTETLTELQRSNEDLEGFANIVSHDIKTPLGRIINYAKLILQKYEKNAIDNRYKEAEQINKIIKNGKDLMELINNILALSRVGNQIDKTDEDIGEIIETVKENLSSEIKETGTQIVHNKMPVAKVCKADFIRLFQNLFLNSINNRTEKPPVIEIKSEKRDDKILFSVSDNGKGISYETKDEIFNLYKRGKDTNYVGNGIGLTACKRIVESHNGEIDFTSEIGKGTTFTFSIKS